MNEQEASRAIGMDTQRVWATQVLPLMNGPVALLLFREVANVNAAVGEQTVEVSRNVASILLPIEVARELGGLLMQLGLEPTSEPK